MELQDRRASVESKRIGERERAEAPSSRAKHIGRPEQAERSRFVRCDDVSQQAVDTSFGHLSWIARKELEMHIVELMMREHGRLDRDLQQCVGEQDPWKSQGLARCALGRTCAYLMALQRCVFPLLIAIGEAPAGVQFEQLKKSAAEALLRSGRHDASFIKALLTLRTDLHAYVKGEGRSQRAALCRALGDGELRGVGSEMLMELAANRRPAPAGLPGEPGSLAVPRLLWACVKAWFMRRRRRPSAMLPVLRHPVIHTGMGARAPTT